MIKEGIRETFNTKTLVMVLVAFVSYTVARLLQSYVLNRIAILAKVPEVADLATMVGAAGLTRGDTSTAAVIGAGLSLLNHLGERFGVAWLKVA